MKYTIEELELIMSDGMADVDCTAGCGYGGMVEPDADYPCPDCGEGRLISPLVEAGLI